MKRLFAICCTAMLLGGCARKGSAPTINPDKAPAQSGAQPDNADKGPSANKLQELERAFDPSFAKKPQSQADQTGVRVQDFVLGQGEAAQVGSRLSLRFVGYLEDGTIFDQNQGPPLPPFRFELPQKPRVQGWGLGLQGMRAGGVRKFVVPPHLGYGDQGDPGDEDVPPIPPNSTLTYLVKMLEVVPPPPVPQPESAFEGEPLSQQTLAGGLVVQDHREGTGPSAQSGDRLVVYVRGYLPDGSMFSSRQRSSVPLTLNLGDERLLAGWNQGLIGMKVKGLRKLKVPPKLGYGKKAVGPIPPNSTLTFSFELIELIKKDTNEHAPSSMASPSPK